MAGQPHKNHVTKQLETKFFWNSFGYKHSFFLFHYSKIWEIWLLEVAIYLKLC